MGGALSARGEFADAGTATIIIAMAALSKVSTEARLVMRNPCREMQGTSWSATRWYRIRRANRDSFRAQRAKCALSRQGLLSAR